MLFFAVIVKIMQAAYRVGGWVAVLARLSLMGFLTIVALAVLYFTPVPALRILFELIVGGFFKLVWAMITSLPLLRDVFSVPPPPPAPIDVRFPFLDQGLLIALQVMLGVVIVLGVMVLYFLNRKPRLVSKFDPYTGEKETFVFESFVDGSHYFPSVMPPFMAKMEIFVEGKWYNAGMCFRAPYGLVTCLHVVNCAEKVRISRGDNSLELPRESFHHFEELGDVAIAQVQVLWLKTAKMSKSALCDDDSVMVMVHDGTKASMGPLRAAEAFGMVKYGGSTAKGFSGSPYFMGNTVYGLHMGAGAANMGYESSYVDMHVRTESSEDYFLDIVRKGVTHKIKRSPFSPDEIMIKLRGRYVIVDEADYYEALGDQREGQSPEEFLLDYVREAAHGFADSENYERPAAAQSAAGQSSLAEENVEGISAPTSSARRLKDLPAGTRRATAPRERTPVRRSSASRPTSQNIPVSSRRVELLQKLKDLQRELTLENTRLGLKKKKRYQPSATSTSIRGSATSPALTPSE